jgi:hypothetical protein
MSNIASNSEGVIFNVNSINNNLNFMAQDI